MPDDDELPPPTLEILDKWLGEVEDKASDARDEAYALRHLLCNLLLKMARSRQIDLDAFIAELRPTIPQIPELHYRETTRILLDDLAAYAARPPSSGVVFH